MAQSCIPEHISPNRKLEQVGPYNPYWTPHKIAFEGVQSNLIQNGIAPSTIEAPNTS